MIVSIRVGEFIPEGATSMGSRLRGVSVGLSIAGLVFLALGIFLGWPRVAVLVLPVILGVVALVLAFRARAADGARPGPVVTFLLAAMAIVAAAVTVATVILGGVFAPSAAYTITVDSTDPVDVTIRNGGQSTTEQWDAGKTIILDSNQTVIGVNAKSSVDTTVVSCEIVRDGNVLVAREGAGSVNCSFIEGGD